MKQFFSPKIYVITWTLHCPWFFSFPMFPTLKEFTFSLRTNVFHYWHIFHEFGSYSWIEKQTDTFLSFLYVAMHVYRVSYQRHPYFVLLL